MISSRLCEEADPDYPISAKARAAIADVPADAFSLTLLFDRAAAKGRLFGLRLEGVWMHVGTPEAVAAAEAALAST